MDLFLNTELTFEKVAAEVTLPEDPNQWHTEILQEVYKQVPYIAAYDVHVDMDKIDAEQKYGFGHVTIENKTELQADASPAAKANSGVNSVKIPVVIKQGKLQPFDLLLTADSKMLPLTERRLRQALFRPQLFDVTSRTPGDQSMIGQLYPPHRQNYGMSGSGMTMGKVGSASILERILPTIRPSDYVQFVDETASIKHAFLANPNTKAALNILAGYQIPEGIGEDKLASAVKATVCQVRKVSDGYEVKMASHQYWKPETMLVDRGEVVRTFGEKVALAADMNGSMTVAEGTTPPVEEPAASKAEIVKEYGVYKVQTDEGKDLIGYVFPNLIDVDGQPLPIALFTNGSVAAVQGEIVGERVSEGAPLFEGKPRGYGVFYKTLSNGRAQASIPFRINGSISSEGEVGLHCQTYDGRSARIVIQSGVTAITGSDDTTIIPMDYKWLPLDQADEVVLVSDPGGFQKAAEVNSVAETVTIRCGGPDSFSFSGYPVEKLAHDEKSFVSFDDALFLLSGLGLSPEYGIKKLAQSMAFPIPIHVGATRGLQMPGDVQSAVQTKVAQHLGKIPQLRRTLVKEAAAMPDPTAVDTVLSIGFINPENITSFIAALPSLEKGQSKMCEILLAARLGLRDVSVEALEKSVRSTEEVIEGLKTLAFQQG